VSGRPAGRSLVARLVLLFVLGSAFIMAAAGYTLYHALGMRLRANEVAEITGKTQMVEGVLRGLRGPEQLLDRLDRLREVTVGHPDLAIGVRASGRWLIALPNSALATAADAPHPRTPGHYVEVESGGQTWLLHRIHGADTADADVVIAVETTHTHELLREHATIAALVALLGTIASALLAWFVARRGLAPLAQVAERAEEVTARRLGARLGVDDAPQEVRGLADSINRMLERLEESFRTLEQFSADIAHELRTPLNNLLLQTHVTLSRPRSAEEYHDALHSNLEELERLQRMVADMLFLARADRGMLDLKLEEIEVRTEIESVAEYFEAAAAENGQRIAINGEGSLRADRLLLRRALNNLLSNAVRYSPREATVSMEVRTGPTGVVIAVSNPAQGLSEAELRRLFARFARRDSSRGRQLEGAGLGLAIVDSIMKLQGGSLDVASSSDRVTFELRFPSSKITNP
jgi:two-component system, OmpR family, heavy metal sensor histidine kinase CusS